ncbi:transposase, partial [bacterium]|nr:transposase [bacterium]
LTKSNYPGRPQDSVTTLPLSTGRPQGAAPTMSLSDIVQRFKMLTTKQYTDGVKNDGWPSFHGRLWQRNFYEHIIRNNPSLDRIREYINNNPSQWDEDEENPNRRP